MRDVTCIHFLWAEGRRGPCRRQSLCFSCCSGCGIPRFDRSGCSCNADAFKALDDLFRHAYNDGQYNYERFMDAFNSYFGKYYFENSVNLSMRPQPHWFDVDLAIKSYSAFFAHFSKSTIAKVRRVATSINRWNFMKIVMLSGEDFMTSSLAFTLKTLAVILKYVDLKLPKLKILDAGCGTGFLVAAANELSRPDAEVWGLDLDANLVHIARREIFESSDSFALGSCSMEDRREKIRIVKGDVELMVGGCADAGGADHMKPFPAEYFDVINIGVAIPVPPRAVECLNDGGLLLLPAPSAENDTDLIYGDHQVAEKCWTKKSCTFQAWRKSGGKLVPIATSPSDAVSTIQFIGAKSMASYSSTLRA